MKIALGCDPAGLKLKNTIIEYLSPLHELEDLGCYTTDPADYPDYAALVAEAVRSGNAERGILICGTGHGVSIAANRHRGIRAVVCYSALSAVMSREHNDSNVLCFGEWQVPPDSVYHIIDAWLFGKFSKGQAHVRRIEKMDGLS